MAHLLRSRGIGPDDRVAVLLDRELELVGDAPGRHPCGAPHTCPLDPDYPPQRLALMLDDSGARLVITQETRQAAATMPGVTSSRSRRWPSICERSRLRCLRASPRRTTWPTSSTLQVQLVDPKAVMVERGNVLNFFAAMDERLGT
jgi:non-ribosomal peptide synthetase component F